LVLCDEVKGQESRRNLNGCGCLVAADKYLTRRKGVLERVGDADATVRVAAGENGHGRCGVFITTRRAFELI
jgi:hypothetical protein